MRGLNQSLSRVRDCNYILVLELSYISHCLFQERHTGNISVLHFQLCFIRVVIHIDHFF